MADFVDGDEQLQDAFEEGNGDANNDEVRVVHHGWVLLLLLPALTLCYVQELATMRARLAQLEDEKTKMEEHTVRHNYSLACFVKQ